MDAKKLRAVCTDIEMVYIINAVGILERRVIHAMSINELLMLRAELQVEQQCRKDEVAKAREGDRQRRVIHDFELWVDNQYVGRLLTDALLEWGVEQPSVEDLKKLWTQCTDGMADFVQRTAHQCFENKWR